jgi:transposase-like protein
MAKKSLVQIAKENLKKAGQVQAVLKKRIQIEKKIKEYEHRLEQLQKECPHHNLEYKNEGSTGSWDRDDSYWTNWFCPDCDKRWTTDQSYEIKQKYPQAIDKTYERY